MRNILLLTDNSEYSQALKNSLLGYLATEGTLKVMIIDNVYSMDIICDYDIHTIVITNGYLEGMENIISEDEYIPLQIKKRAAMFAEKMGRTIRTVLHAEFDRHARGFYKDEHQMQAVMKNEGIIWYDPLRETSCSLNSFVQLILE